MADRSAAQRYGFEDHLPCKPPADWGHGAGTPGGHGESFSAARHAPTAAHTASRPEAALSDAELLAAATERPWYFDGWDIFTAGSSAGPRGDGHRLVVPLSHLNETWHPSQQVSRFDAELIVRAVNAYGALERERAQRRWAFAQLRDWWRGVPRDTSNPEAALREFDRVEALLDD